MADQWQQIRHEWLFDPNIFRPSYRHMPNNQMEPLRLVYIVPIIKGEELFSRLSNKEISRATQGFRWELLFTSRISL